MKLNEVLEMAKAINGLDVVSVRTDKDGDVIATMFLDDEFFDDNWNEVENDDVDWNAYENMIDELDEKAERLGTYSVIYKVEDGYVKINSASEDF